MRPYSSESSHVRSVRQTPRLSIETACQCHDRRACRSPSPYSRTGLCHLTLPVTCPPSVFNIDYIRRTDGSVAEWLACWTQAQKGLGSNRSRDAVG